MPVLNGQKVWSPIDALLQWCREWTEAGSISELKYCAPDEVERMAHEAGVSTGELRTLASKGPELAELLLRRMAALDLDQDEVARIEPQVFHDLQRVCTMCESHGRCMRDLRRDAADPAWKNYCPNVDTLMDLDSLPWSSRREY